MQDKRETLDKQTTPGAEQNPSNNASPTNNNNPPNSGTEDSSFTSLSPYGCLLLAGSLISFLEGRTYAVITGGLFIASLVYDLYPRESKPKEIVATQPKQKFSDYIGDIPKSITKLVNIINAVPEKRQRLIRFGVEPPMGILLEGPPGCGKTMLAEILSGELNCPFIEIKCATLLSEYVYEPSKKIHAAFTKAIKAAESSSSKLCILFFDEFDSIAPKRKSNSDSNTKEHINTMVNTVLQNIQSYKTGDPFVIVLAATNHKANLDEAVLDRFDCEYIGKPNAIQRKGILEKTLLPRACDISNENSQEAINWIVNMTNDISSRQLLALAKRAANLACNDPSEPEAVQHTHLYAASLEYLGEKVPKFSSAERFEFISKLLISKKVPLNETIFTFIKHVTEVTHEQPVSILIDIANKAEQKAMAQCNNNNIDSRHLYQAAFDVFKTVGLHYEKAQVMPGF